MNREALEILFLYGDFKAMRPYLNNLLDWHKDRFPSDAACLSIKKKLYGEWLISAPHILIRCKHIWDPDGQMNGLSGLKYDILAVDRALCWLPNWNELMNNVVMPQLISPISVQYF